MRIDSLHNKKKHIRHEVVRVTAGGWAHTRCGRKLIYYTKAENLSWFYTDGTRYAWPCRICCPEEHAALQEPTVCAECDSVIQPGEAVQQRDDGQPLCTDCYKRLCGPRDRADAPYVYGDHLLDQAREDGRRW